VNFTPNWNGANRARIRTVCAIVGTTSIDHVSEYYVFRVSIANVSTTGTGSCEGCTDGACIVLNRIRLTQPSGVGDYTITTPLARAHVLWQAGGSQIGGLGCPGQLPVRKATWGAVKSMYR
jgi:4-alpha-glucanotransferase